jgi:hypothetical protein
MDLDIVKITDKIIHVKFPTQKEMSETLIRYQEYYECPQSRFRGKIFTLGQIQKYYTKKNGIFSYTHDIGGFNIPSWVLKPFKDRWFDPLTVQEQEFLNIFRDREDKFYIICTCTWDDKTSSDGYLDHELLHALFYLSRRYRDKVKSAVKGHKLLKLFRWLIKQGYCNDVDILLDELQAYLGSEPDIFDDNNITYSKKLCGDLQKIAKVFLRRLKRD